MKCGKRATKPRDLSTLRGIVDDHIRCKRLPESLGLGFYAGQPTLAAAIDVAALCKMPNGKRYSHQYRIRGEALAEARRRLLAVDLASAKNFDELHDLVAAAVRGVWKKAELTIYDIAHRIGAHLGLAPERVYLHCGTRRAPELSGSAAGAPGWSCWSCPASSTASPPPRLRTACASTRTSFATPSRDIPRPGLRALVAQAPARMRREGNQAPDEEGRRGMPAAATRSGRGVVCRQDGFD